jgi:endonuclease-3 related protein
MSVPPSVPPPVSVPLSAPVPAAGAAPPPESLPERLLRVYARLIAAYGPQGWWPGGGDPFEVIVGAVLTQAVSWRNVELALENLRAAGALTLAGVHALDDATLAALIRPSGYYTVKAGRLRAVVRLVRDGFGGDLARLLGLPLDDLRPRLLATHGIGQETADAILVYAAGQPSFVVDAYAVRLFGRLGLAPPGRPTGRYASWRDHLMAHLPADATLFNEYHALNVRHGKERCRKRAPRCPGCPLIDLCPAGRAGAAQASS